MSEDERFDQTHAITLGGTGSGGAGRVLKSGDLVGGSYRLKSLLGKGGMGYVFCAEHTMIKKDYALKMLAPELLNEISRQRFEIEGKAISRLDHANIVKVYNMGLDGGDCPFYVMDLLHGQALSDYIASGQGLSLEECLDVFIQIAAGLGYAHGKGIVHRDVKPSNIILLTDDSGKRQVKIVDFGIAKLLPSADLQSQSKTTAGAIFGSPLYMSPEQSMGDDIDPRSDIYSLGCTFFEAMCGRPPFCGSSALHTMLMHQDEPTPNVLEALPQSHLPQSADVLLARMMAKRPQDRYQSMEQLMHDLERMKQGKTIGASVGESAKAISTDGLDHQSLEDQGFGNHFRGGALSAIVIATLVLALLGGSAAFWLRSTKRDNHNPLNSVAAKASTVDLEHTPEPTPKQVAESPVFRAARTAYAQCAAIKSTKVFVDGKRRKRFHFPLWTIGKVSCPGLDIEAQGQQDVPAEAPLKLLVGPRDSVQVFYNPSIFEVIDKSEFSALVIDGKMFINAESVHEGPADSGGLKRILSAASKWTQLDSLTLQNISLSKDEFAALNNYPHLVHLDLFSVNFHVSDLAQQPFLHHLKKLWIKEAAEPGPLCRALKDLPNLQELKLMHCALSENELEPLLESRQIPMLGLDQRELVSLVPCLIRHHSVKKLALKGQPLTAAQISAITACPNISVLQLARGEYHTKEATLFQHYPKVQFAGGRRDL